MQLTLPRESSRGNTRPPPARHWTRRFHSNPSSNGNRDRRDLLCGNQFRARYRGRRSKHPTRNRYALRRARYSSVYVLSPCIGWCPIPGSRMSASRGQRERDLRRASPGGGPRLCRHMGRKRRDVTTVVSHRQERIRMPTTMSRLIRLRAVAKLAILAPWLSIAAMPGRTQAQKAARKRCKSRSSAVRSKSTSSPGVRKRPM